MIKRSVLWINKIFLKLELNIESKYNKYVQINCIDRTKKQISKREYSTKIRRNLVKAAAKSLNLKSKLITNYSFPIAYRFREEESL